MVDQADSIINSLLGDVEAPTDSAQFPTDDCRERLKELLRGMTTRQIEFIVARLDTNNDKEAAEKIKVPYTTVRGWDNKQLINEAVALLRYDGIITALELRRRHLAEAMLIKVAGLHSRNEKLKQAVASELIEWELGKAPATVKHTGDDGGAIKIMSITEAITQVYGNGSDSQSG